MKHKNVTAGSRVVLLCALGLLFVGPAQLKGQAPDLTVGTTRDTIYTNSQYYVGSQLYTYNLGPTGLRGWIYVLCNQPNVMDNYTTNAPFQILVTSVGTNTPASSILFTNDVILGVKAGLPPVSLFTNDTRVTLGNAITDAEADNGKLSFLVNRYGYSTNLNVTIQLRITNMTYSATAPYNCPKSALILSNALNVINKNGIGYLSQALALLASGNTNYLPLVQSYARSLAPADLVVGWPSYQIGFDSWTIGLRGLILAEYYQVTHDSQVTNALTQYIGMLAKSDTMWGCYGHGGAKVMPYHVAAGVHGYGAGYGPVNACGLLCKLAMAVAQKTGIPSIVNDPEFQPAIDRSINFYGYYVQKGGVPYGEMGPYWDHHCPTGKDGLPALFFGVLGNQSTQAQYFSRLSVASHHSREWGHNGGGWGLCWDQLGTVMGGTNAAAAYAANTRWYQELARRSDGSFAYDCPGDTPSTAANYWDNEDYQGCLDPTGWNALFLSAPKQALYITGKNANPTNYLTDAAVSNAVWAGLYDLNLSSYSTNQLIAHLSEYQPSVRHAAAQQLAAICATNAALSNALVPQLITLTTNTNSWVRSAACDALRGVQSTNVLNALAARMFDSDVWVRFNANAALDLLGTAALPQLTNIMTAFTTYATTDPLVSINWSDPCGWGNGCLAHLLFQTLATDTMNQSTNLLYPVLIAGLRQPDRWNQGQIGSIIRNQLQWQDVLALAPYLMTAASKVSQANEMYGAGAIGDALACLAKFGVDDGLAAVAVTTDCGFATDGRTFIDFTPIYQTYGTEASQLLPTLYNMETTPGVSNTYAGFVATLQANTNNLPAVHSFKQFTVASATPSLIDISAATNVVLNVAATDLSGWGLRYEWSVAQGPGTVSFSNATNANCTASFSAPGVYVLQAGAAPIMDRNLFWDPTLPGGAYIYATPMWTFSTWTNFYGATYTNMIVTVIGSPAVDNTGGVLNQTLTSATLQGQLTAGGRANAWICWGDHDAGINSTSAWDNVQAAGVVFQGAGFSVPVTGLAPDKTYFYRCFVANEDGQAWSAAAISFSAVPARNGSGFGMKISFTNYNQAETLTNFPALVVFSNGMAGAYFDFSTFLSTNGYDLRFTDSTGLTNLNYEIESWSIGGYNAAYVWVQVPRFYSNCCVWAKWGNILQTNQLACTTNGAAWDSTFKGVWHFPLGASLTALDSTSNRNNGTVVSATATNGVIGGGMNAASGSQYIDLTNRNNSLDVSTGDWTMQAWAKPSYWYVRWVNLVNVGNYGINGTFDGRWGLLQANNITASANSSPDSSIFQHVMATCSGTTNKIYINGSLQSGVDPGDGNFGLGGTCRIGEGYYGQFTGSIDEVRIEGVARSSNWVWACYMNMASNSFFNTPSAALPFWPIANLAPTGITTNSATLNASMSVAVTNYAVTVYWGTTNGGTNAGAWTYSASVGSWTNVALTNIAYPASGLSTGTKYYYAFRATNATTNLWATPSWQFLTLGVNGVTGGSSPGKFKGISVSGTTLGLVVTNGTPGGVWTLLQSTNLALPISQWQTNCTGTYDSGGNLSTNFANIVTNRMGFYLLK